MKKSLLVLGCVLSLAVTRISAQCLTLFYDGFESGTYVPTWTTGSGTYTYSVPSVAPAVGNFNVQLASPGANTFYQGLTTTFTAGQPNYMSWWMRTDVTSGANGYVVIGDANIPTDNGIIFCYFNATSGLRFFNTTGYNHPIVANTWYHVEARNMNWTTRTSDIYVNNVLILTSWAFRSTTATSIDRIHLHSLVASTAQYDEFVIGNPAVVTTVSSTGASCFGNSDGTATVTVTSGTAPYTYSWAPSGGTLAVASVAAGTYTCTVTDANGCTNATTVTVTEPAVLTATTMQTNVSCNGGSNGDAMVMVTGGTPVYTYSWGPTGGTNASATGLTPGVYTCYVTDANGCQMTRTFNITEPSQALTTAAANNGDVCPGDTAMLFGTAMGGTMNYTYDWSPGNMSGSLATSNPANTTTYTLLVTDANGCTSSSTTTVTVYTAPVVSLGADIISCGNAMLDAQNAGSSFLWSEGSTTQMITVMMSGPYDVVVTDGNGCTGMDTINVTINANPIVVGSAAMNFVCAGEPTVQLFESPAGGAWTGAGVFGSTFEPDTAGVGTHDLVYSYTDSLGCSGVDTISITVDLCLGINPVADSDVNVYPNPTNGVFEVVFSTEANNVLIEITDVQGRVIYSSKESFVAQGAHKQIDVSAQADGIYLMRINTGATISVNRLVIQH